MFHLLNNSLKVVAVNSLEIWCLYTALYPRRLEYFSFQQLQLIVSMYWGKFVCEEKIRMWHEASWPP
jgi:hypothetical protein